MSVDVPAIAQASSRRRRRLLGGLGPLGIVAVVAVALAAIVAVVGPYVAPHNPNDQTLSDAFFGPYGDHLLGNDGQGRDLLSRLLAGARTSMLGPLAVVVLSGTAGVVLALASAWRGGWLDAVVSRVLDVLFAFPGLLFAILAVALFGTGLTAPIIALAIAYTPFFARILRGAAIRERAQPYVSALEVQGFSGFVIALRHLLPNLGPLIVAQATTNFGYAMIDLAGLSFIGLGVQDPQPDWGAMVNSGEQGIVQGYPAESLLAGACIVIVVGAFNLLGERLSDRAERSGAR